MSKRMVSAFHAAMALVALAGAIVVVPAVTGTAGIASAAELPQGFTEETVFSGLTNPTAVRFSPDGRVFVAEKSGLIKVFDNLSDTTATVFADLSTEVYNFWDRGLLGLELHPDFPNTPYVYALYTHDAAIGATAPRWGTPGVLSDPCPSPPGATNNGCLASGRLTRLTASGNTSVARQVLLEGWCQQFPSHSVGSIDFGADGQLYLSGGDGASFVYSDYGQTGNPCGDPGGASPTPPTAEGGSLRAQDIRTSGDPVGLNGTVLRIDPITGAGSPGNPLASSSDANAQRIVATGMRNPFRLAIRPGTNEVWVGDVGAGDWEEIDLVGNPTDGAVDNFGWPCYEGPNRQGGFDATNLNICENLYAETGAVTAPYFSYSHSDRVTPSETCPTGGSAIAGLAFAPAAGGPYPVEYAGALFFADNTRQCIWAMLRGADGRPSTSQVRPFVQGAASPVDVQIGPEGMLYYADFDGGRIRRVRYTGGTDTTAPTVSVTSPVAAATGVSVDANVTATFSEAVNAATVTATTARVTPTGGSTPVTATVTYDAPSRTVTIDPSAPLAASGGYSATITGGAGGVTDLAGNPLAANFTWTFTTAAAGGGAEQFVSDLPFVGTPTNGWGPVERDRSNGEQGATDGAALRIGTETYAKGLGAHAASEVRFAVPSGCTRLQARVGIDEEVTATGSARFQVLAGTVVLADSGVRTFSDAAFAIDADVTGRAEIRLVVTDAGNGNAFDHADWGNARFICATTPPVDSTPPTVSGATPAAGVTGIDVTANATATFSEAMDAATITTATVQLAPTGSTAVSAAITYDAASRTVTLDPAASLTPSTGYTATIVGGAGGVKDVAGNPLAADFTWTFTTTAPGNAPPTPVIVTPTTTTTWSVGDELTFSGSADDAEDGPLAADRLTWTLVMQHCPSNCHSHVIQSFVGVASGSFVAPDHEYPSHLELRLTATDSAGSATTTVLEIQPNVVDLSFATNPPGLQLGVNTFSGAAPFTRTVIVGSSNAISAPSPQTITSGTYAFAGWSDGGAQTHQVTAPGTPTTYTAQYTLTAGSSEQFVSDLPFVGTPTNGWGPVERDRSNGEQGATDGTTLRIGTETFTKGLGAHANSEIRFAVPSGCTRLQARVGIDEEINWGGSVLFQVLAGTTVLATSGTRTNNDTAFAIDADVTGRTEIRLTVTDTGNGNAGDHADWGNARFICGTPPADTTAPTVTATSPIAGATGVGAGANVTATFSEAMNPGTITAATVTLTPTGTTTPVPAAVTYDAGSRTVTLDPTAALTAGAGYTATVTTGVRDAAGNALAANLNWTFTTTAAAGGGSEQFVSDLPFVGTPTNGWGPVERDRSNGEQGATDGLTMRIGTETFTKGLGAHAASEVRFAVPSGCTRLQARVGIDEEVTATGSARFQVLAGTVVLADSGVRTFSDAAFAIDADVTGRAEIRLVVTDAGNGNNSDHADWGNARFICGPVAPDTTPPTVTSTSPVGGAPGVAVGANVTATFSEAMDATTVTGATVQMTPTGSTTPVPAAVTYDAGSRTVTLDPTASLAAATSYGVTITTGVKDAAGNALAANHAFTFTTAAAGGATTERFVSDLPFVGTPTNGWGPVERDRSNGEQGATDGTTLRIGTETFTKGLGAHANSEIRFAVPSGCTRLQARVGIDEEINWGGSVLFQVLAGTTVLATSGTRTNNDTAFAIDADVTGRTEIRLTVTDTGNGNAGDHADWGNARFICPA